MRKVYFYSIFADAMTDYVDIKTEDGHKAESYLRALHELDVFCDSVLKLTEPVLTAEHMDLLMAQGRGTRSHKTFANVMTVIRRFLVWLQLSGYEVTVPDKVGTVKENYEPHIYTADETHRYNDAADCYVPEGMPHLAMEVPLMIRTLQCTGMRCGELLRITQSDLELGEGIITLSNTKNGRSRKVPLSRGLHVMYFRAWELWISSLEPGDTIWRGAGGQPLSYRGLYRIHRDLLHMAGIPWLGEGRGPRIHDWRHTFCVNSFIALSAHGRDIRNVLPYLSIYLGHSHVSATEKYLRLHAWLYPEVAAALSTMYAENINNISSDESTGGYHGEA